MGRLTNSIGIRLGKKNIWSNFGILTKKDNCVKYINFLKIVSSLLYLGKLKYKKFILAKAILVQEKKVLKLKIFLYKEDGIRYAIKYKKLIKKFFLKRYYLLKKKNNKTKVIKKKTYSYRVYNKKKKFKLKKKFIIKKRNVLYNKLKKNLKINYSFFFLKKKRLKIGYLRIFNKIRSILQRIKVKKNVLLVLLKKIKELNNKNVYIKSKIFLKKYLIFYIKSYYKLKKKDNFLINKKLSFFFWIKKKYKVIKLYKNLLFYKKLKNNKFFNLTIKTKKNYSIRYLYKYTVINNKLYKYLFRIIYKKGIILKNVKNIENRNILTIKNKQFLLGLLHIEKMLLECTKLYLMQELQCNYYIVTNYNFTAQVLTKYICIKLKQRFTINQVVKSLLKYLQKLVYKKKNLFGYRVELSGRFTRKQRATLLLFKGGTVPLGTVSANIDYYADFVILKDGVGSIKVWLNKTNKFKEAVISYKV